MKNLHMLTRTWYIGVDRHAYDATPVAQHHAEALLDIAVASSVQSLTETRDELQRIVSDAMQQMSEYEEKSKGFHRSAMYKGRMLAFEDFINLLAREVTAYEKRIAANHLNNGRVDTEA